MALEDAGFESREEAVNEQMTRQQVPFRALQSAARSERVVEQQDQGFVGERVWGSGREASLGGRAIRRLESPHLHAD